jgi:hypothetical protein
MNAARKTVTGAFVLACTINHCHILFRNSVKTFKMLQVEQEFNKLAQDSASLSHQPDFIAAEVACPTKDDIPVRRRQDSEVSLEKDDRNASPLALTETPRRPKPTTLDIPARRALQEEAEAQSPDTSGYASRPLPMSPRGPAFANIPLRRVKQTPHHGAILFFLFGIFFSSPRIRVPGLQQSGGRGGGRNLMQFGASATRFDFSPDQTDSTSRSSVALPHSPRRRMELSSPEDVPKRREEWSSPEDSPQRRGNELSSSEGTPRRRGELSSPEDTTPRRRKESSSPEDTPLCSVPPLPPSRLDLGEDVDEFQGKAKKNPSM